MPDTTAEAALERKSAAAHRVGWGFIALYTLAFMSNCLVFLAPLLVTLALKVNSLVGIEQAPSSLAVVTGIGALLAIVGNPFFGRSLTSRQTEAVRVGWPNMLGRTPRRGVDQAALGALDLRQPAGGRCRHRRHCRPGRLGRHNRRPANPGHSHPAGRVRRLLGPVRARRPGRPAVLFTPPILGALVSNGIVATAIDYLPAGLSGVVASGTGERYSPEVAALLLGTWAIVTLAVGPSPCTAATPDHQGTSRGRALGTARAGLGRSSNLPMAALFRRGW
jgi:hypothetical protein